MLRGIRIVFYVWTSPNTSLGIVLATLGLPLGGRISLRAGIIEAHGGLAERLLTSRMINAHALTLGHSILARDRECLEQCREHELAHVRQYEILGPFFIPAYFAASVWAWMRGQHYYHDNWFERDAENRCRLGQTRNSHRG